MRLNIKTSTYSPPPGDASTFGQEGTVSCHSPDRHAALRLVEAPGHVDLASMIYSQETNK